MVSGGLSWQGLRLGVHDDHAGNWHPLTWLSHMLDVQLFGRWAGGTTWSALVLHAANAVLLLALLRGADRRALARRRASRRSSPLHPLHVESVAWVAERKDVLAALLLAPRRCAPTCATSRRPGAGRYAGRRRRSSPLGLMAKPMLVTLPLVLLLLDWWPLGRLRRAGAAGPLVARSSRCWRSPRPRPW